MTNNQVNEYHRGQLVQIDENNGNQKYNYYPNVLLDDVYVSDIVIEGSEENQMEFLETVPLQQRINIGEGATSDYISINNNDGQNNIYGIAIGKSAQADGGGVSIGNYSKAKKGGLSYGQQSEVNELKGISIGGISDNKITQVNGEYGIAIGFGTIVDAPFYGQNSGIAIGKEAETQGNGIAIGKNAESGEDGISIGDGVKNIFRSIAIGGSDEDQQPVVCMSGESIAIGYGTQIEDGVSNDGVTILGEPSIAIGTKAKIMGSKSIALGFKANVEASNSIQLGTGTNSNPDTLQFKSYTIIDANGNIPMDRLSTVLADYSKTKIYYGTEAIKDWENKPTDPANGTIYFQITQEGENNNE